jgi:YHS domain-containing protein
MKDREIRECNLDQNRLAIQGYSPVSYLEEGKAEKGVQEFAVTYRDVTYYMTSAEQVEKFKANPDKYEPAYGGWCAYGMAIEKKFPIDPHAFKIVDNRTFLFLRNEKVDALELWDKEKEKPMTDKADNYWNSLTEK